MPSIDDLQHAIFRNRRPTVAALLGEHSESLGGALDRLVAGEVERYEMPNLRALNFILHDSLGGGGSASLKTDAQGKTHGMAMLRLLIEVPDDYAPPDKMVAPDGELPCAW